MDGIMHFPIPLNDLIGPSIAVSLFGAAVAVAVVAWIYSGYLKRQEAAWGKPGVQR